MSVPIAMTFMGANTQSIVSAITSIGDTNIGSADAELTLTNTGTITVAGNESVASARWLSGGSASSWSVRLNRTTGTSSANPTSGPILGDWQPATSTNTWLWSRSAPFGYTTAFFNVQYSKDGGATVAFTDSFSFELEAA